MSTNDPCDYILKLLVLGDTGVGKTSLLTRYVEDRFSATFATTVGVDFCQKKIKFDYKGVCHGIQLQLWDTAGQERFRSLTSSFFRDAMGFLLVFDLTNENSFHHINDWLVQLHTHCYNDQPPVVIVGNKIDKERSRSVSKDSANAISVELGYRYLETSALNNTNVNEAVGALLEQVLDKVLYKEENADHVTADHVTADHVTSDHVTITPPKLEPTKGSCYC